MENQLAWNSFEIFSNSFLHRIKNCPGRGSQDSLFFDFDPCPEIFRHFGKNRVSLAPKMKNFRIRVEIEKKMSHANHGHFPIIWKKRLKKILTEKTQFKLYYVLVISKFVYNFWAHFEKFHSWMSCAPFGVWIRFSGVYWTGWKIE